MKPILCPFCKTTIKPKVIKNIAICKKCNKEIPKEYLAKIAIKLLKIHRKITLGY